MGFLKDWFSLGQTAPQNSYQPAGGGIIVNTPEELAQALQTGNLSRSGKAVTPENAMRVAAVYACVRIISGAVATMPLNIMKRTDARTREDASDQKIWEVLRRKPNGWQKPAQFRRMMQAHVLLRGNAYAVKTYYRGNVVELIPLNPDRVEVVQNDNMTLEYILTRKDGGKVKFQQKDILHLMGLSLDGVRGVTPIAYAREAIGLSLSMEEHGSTVFRNGAQVGGILSTDKPLNAESVGRLKESIDEYRADGDRAMKIMVLENGLKYESMTMTQEDAQWLEGRKFSRSDIAMFFGVPPHMIGDTEKSTSWGTGIEQQSQGFVTYTLEDHLTMWEESVTIDCITDPKIYAKFNRAALVRGDIKSRWEAHVKALQWGVSSPNEIRAIEDQNPRDDGDVYYDPPNTAGGMDKENADDPTQAS